MAYDPRTLCAAALLALAVALLLARTPEATAGLYAWAALPQAVLAVVVGTATGAWPVLYPDALAMLLIKGIWAPRLLRRAVRHDGEVYGQRAAWSAAALLAAAGALTLLGLRLGLDLDAPLGVPLGLSLAAMFVGFGTTAMRRELWSQSGGLLLAEGGLMGAVLVLASGLPALGEALALTEVVLLAAVLGAVTRSVVAVHGAADSRLLRRLRG